MFYLLTRVRPQGFGRLTEYSVVNLNASSQGLPDGAEAIPSGLNVAPCDWQLENPVTEAEKTLSEAFAAVSGAPAEGLNK